MAVSQQMAVTFPFFWEGTVLRAGLELPPLYLASLRIFSLLGCPYVFLPVYDDQSYF